MEKSDFYDRVLAGTQKVDVVLETENILAFYHTRPSYPYHVVIIPKRKILDFMDVKTSDATMLCDVFIAVQNLLKNEDFKEKGFKIVSNAGIYQDSAHLHFHLISGPFLKK